MLKVTARADYAMRAMVAVARRHPGAVTGREVAAAEGIPYRFLSGVLTTLAGAGLLEGRRGGQGGYRLGRPPGAITAWDVLTAVEGRVTAPTGERATTVGSVWAAVGEAVEQALARITVSGLAAPEGPGASPGGSGSVPAVHPGSTPGGGRRSGTD